MGSREAELCQSRRYLGVALIAVFYTLDPHQNNVEEVGQFHRLKARPRGSPMGECQLELIEHFGRPEARRSVP
jgi:hypothetical protein